MKLFLGFAGYYSTRLYDNGARAERLASLLVDDRWPWAPCWAHFWLRDDFHKHTRGRKVVGAKGSAFLAAGLTSADYQRLFLYRSSREPEDYSSASLETGTRVISRDHENPFETWGVMHGDDLPERKSLRERVELVHDYMTALDVGSATISAFDDKDSLLNDITLSRRVKMKNVDFEPPDYPRQIQRAIFVREKLGGTYVRHPRWGNYLGLEHVAKIGGIERIRSEVAPAQLIELGRLVFIGLTDDPRDALTAECERKRAALELLMAPIVAPPQAKEDPIVFPS